MNTLGEKVELRDKVRWLRFSEFDKYYYKHSLSEEESWKTVVLVNCDSSALPAVPELVIQQRRLPINPAKLKNIHKQLKFVPTQYQAVYLSLVSGDTKASTAEYEETGGESITDVRPCSPLVTELHRNNL